MSGGRLLHGYVIAFVAVLYMPVLLLPMFSVNDSASPTFPMKGFTWRWYESLADNASLHAAAWNSLVVALSTAFLSTVLGICAARALTRHKFRGRLAAGGLIMAPLVLPEIVIGVSMLIVLIGVGLELSLVTIILGHLLFTMPYSTTVLMSGFENFDPSMEEASLDLGETPFSTLRRVTLPILAPAVVSSLLVSFTISLDEFILAFFLGGTESTLPVYIWGQLRVPRKLPSVLALGSILVVASVLMLVAAEVLRRRAERKLAGRERGAPA